MRYRAGLRAFVVQCSKSPTQRRSREPAGVDLRVVAGAGRAFTGAYFPADAGRRDARCGRRGLPGLGAGGRGGLSARHFRRAGVRSARPTTACCRKTRAATGADTRTARATATAIASGCRARAPAAISATRAPASSIPKTFRTVLPFCARLDFPWHDQDFVTPDFSDMVVYQLHVGTFAIYKPGVCSTFLDVALKIPYLADLGINVLQPLPIDEQECQSEHGLWRRGPVLAGLPLCRDRGSAGLSGKTQRALRGEAEVGRCAGGYPVRTRAAQGAGRPLPCLRHRRDVRRGLQPRRRIFGRREVRRQLPVLHGPPRQPRRQQRQPLFHRPGSRHRRAGVRAVERRCREIPARQCALLSRGVSRRRLPL